MKLHTGWNALTASTQFMTLLSTQLGFAPDTKLAVGFRLHWHLSPHVCTQSKMRVTAVVADNCKITEKNIQCTEYCKHCKYRCFNFFAK